MDNSFKIEAGKRFKKFADNYFKGNKKKLSELLGLKNQSQLAAYFNGKAILGQDKLAKVRLLGFNTDFYLYGEGNISNANTVKEKLENYAALKSDEAIELLNENKALKAEIYDLQKEVSNLRKEIYELKVKNI